MKVSKKICSIILSVLMIVSMFVPISGVTVSAATVPTLLAESVTAESATEVSIAVKITNSSGVYNGNFTLQYDSSKLEAVSYSYGNIFNEHTRNCNLNYQSTGNQIRFTFSGAYALTGDGTLITFTFNVKENVSGNAALNFTAYKMYDENGLSLSPTAINGNIDISAKETAKPEISVIGGTVNAGETISVPVKIINTASIYNGNFTLKYDSSKLDAVSYTYGSIFNEHTKNCNLDYQSTGNQIRFTFSGAYPLTGDGTLVTFNFKAKENVSGNATLNFTAYKMYDENGISFSPTAVNGVIEVSENSSNIITGQCGDNAYYELNLETGLLCITGTGDMYNYKYLGNSGYSVPWYDFKDSIKNIELSDNLTSIGEYAFAKCNNIKDILIPKNIKKIGHNAFGGCSNLSKIEILSETLEIGMDAFSYTKAYYDNYKDGSLYIDGNRLIMISEGYSGEYIIQSGTKTIATSAFEGCKDLTKVIIPNTVVDINPNSFHGCESLEQVEIPFGVTRLPEYSFARCYSLKKIVIPSSVSYIDSTAFFETNNVVIYGISNSYAESYAQENDIPFIALDSVKLSSISIFSEPTKQIYYAGDYLDTKGLQLKLTYSDGSSEIVSSRYTTNLDGVSLGAGTKNVIVTYQGLTTTFSINVQNISGTITPSCLDLIVGDTYTLTSSLQAPEDAILTWVTSDNSVVTVSNGVVRAVGIGTAKVYVRINNNGFATASEFCTVIVSESPAVLKSISISSKPTKTIYEIGEALDISGLRIKLNYNDGSSEIISSGFTTSGFSSTTAGTKTVTVNYGGKTTSFNVMVKNSVVEENAPYLTMDSIVTSAGNEITLSLNIKNNPGIAGLAISIIYDENAFTLKDVKNGNLFDAFTYGKNFVWDDSKNITSDGTLATFVFSVSEDAEAGDYIFEIISRSCVNIDLEDVELLSVNPTVTVSDFIYGDTNGDGSIDMKDVVLLRKYMANYDYDTESSSEVVEPGADANGDSNIDMKDVVLLRKYLANYDYDTGSSSVVLGPQ